MYNDYLINRNEILYKELEKLNEDKLIEYIRTESYKNPEYFERCRNIVLKVIEKEFGKESVK